MKYDELGNRMKRYEASSRHLMVRRMPTIIRVDGRAFHTLTKTFQRPFDQHFIDSMVLAAIKAAGEMQGFKFAYVQSDEASFVLTDYDSLQTEPWFGGVQAKIESVTASAMTFGFARGLRLSGRNDDAFFDARAFNLPESDVANYFLWRARDWHRNSVSMYTRTFFSHSKMRGMRIPDMHEMLHSVGRNWSTDLSDEIKNGTFIVAPDLTPRHNILPNYADISALWDSVNPTQGGPR